MYANNKLKLQQQKNIVMRFKPFTEKIRKKIGICSGRIRIQTRIRIHYPEGGSADPKHCQEQKKYEALASGIRDLGDENLNNFFR